MPLGGAVILGGGALIKGVGGWLSNRKKNKAAKEQAQFNNAFLNSQRMAQAKMMAGLQDSGWNPFGVNQLKSGLSEQSTSTTRGSRDFYSKENPFVTDEYKKQDDLIRGIIENRLSRGSSLPPGYEANAIRAINQASAGGAAAASNAAARRGLSGQQVFGLNAPIQTARAGQIADLRGNVPLLEREMMNADMALSGQRQAQFGTGRETRSREDTRSTTNSSGTSSGFREVGPDIGALSSLLMPPGAQQSTMNPNSGWGSALSAVGDAGMAVGSALYGNQQDSGGGGGGGGGGNPFTLSQPPTTPFNPGFNNTQFTCPPGNPFCR